MAGRFVLVLAAAGVLLSGCGEDNGAPAAGVDTSDPLQVAEAFYRAVDDGNLEGALEHVDPDMADDFREAMSGGMPSMPPDYEVMVMAQGDEAEASVTGADLEVDMIQIDGRWWITR